MPFAHRIDEINNKGFAIVDKIYTSNEIGLILSIIDAVDTNKDIFRKSDDLFAIRQFLKEIPAVIDVVFNQSLKNLINSLFGTDYFLVKSIYFDKPESSNWFVSYHQDLTISVDKKVELEGFGTFTNKQNQFAVQPPVAILQDNFTIRIHLDDTDEENGALKVIPKSHLKGIYRLEDIKLKNEDEISCCLAKGGVMIMKPLLMHSSSRTTNNKRRRVIHLEFSKMQLPTGLQWAEHFKFQ